MALRSLAFKFKAVPLRVPASCAFTTNPKPKGDLSSKIAAAFDRTKYNSAREMFDAVMPLMQQQEKFSREQYLNHLKLCRWAIVLLGFGGVGSVGYLASSV